MQVVEYLSLNKSSNRNCEDCNKDAQYTINMNDSNHSLDNTYDLCKDCVKLEYWLSQLTKTKTFEIIISQTKMLCSMNDWDSKRSIEFLFNHRAK